MRRFCVMSCGDNTRLNEKRIIRSLAEGAARRYVNDTKISARRSRFNALSRVHRVQGSRGKSVWRRADIQAVQLGSTVPKIITGVSAV